MISFLAFLVTFFLVPERFTRSARAKQKASTLAAMRVVTGSPGLMAVIFVTVMGQFATQSVQPVVTLFVREMLGMRPDIATLAGLAFSVTGLAGVIAVLNLGGGAIPSATGGCC